SQMAGDTTVSHKQVSYRGGRFDLVMDHRHITQQEVRRRLLTPDEAMRLDAGHEVVFVAGELPIYAAKLKYFEDSALGGRARAAVPSISGRADVKRSGWASLRSRRAKDEALRSEDGDELRDLARSVDDRSRGAERT
ncbi:MAG: type IV secretory system conjugative DNA transfer family protein, partial [Acidobacteria bacterium]|nr:type IV secretory system conjugative DNA transfer family protein [Acidobacteriota bacterium]